MLNAMYSAATLVFSLAITPLFLLSPRGRVRLYERFGVWKKLGVGEILWFHGASVGEIRGLLPLIKILKERHPHFEILVTATSPTALSDLPDYVNECRLLPFDNGVWIRPALSDANLKAFIFTETELWPALLNVLKRRGVPCYLVNGKISDFTWRRYRFLKFLLKPMLSALEQIMVPDNESRRRFVELGADPERVHVTGNSKYDISPKINTDASQIRAKYIADADRTIVLGSIRPGEEGPWLGAYTNLASRGMKFKMIVAPRHQEKFEYFALQLRRFGISFVQRSLTKAPLSADMRVLLLDTMGDLAEVYSFVDLAFIGATLIDLGGHNPLEAAIYATPICMGPYATNIKEIQRELIANNALSIVENQLQIEELLQKLLTDPRQLKEQGQAAHQVWRSNFGASARIAERIRL